MLPGPVTRSTFGHSPGTPYANIAMACAPPTAYTSSTPSSAHSARMLGCGSPPKSFCGGLATAIDATPAACAGTTFMMTLDASGARPPGTYRPTRPTGTSRVVTVAPGASSVVGCGMAASSAHTRRRRRIDSSNAARSSGSSSAQAGVEDLGRYAQRLGLDPVELQAEPSQRRLALGRHSGHDRRHGSHGVLDVELGPRHHGRVVKVGVSSVTQVDSSEHGLSLLRPLPRLRADITCRHHPGGSLPPVGSTTGGGPALWDGAFGPGARAVE